MPHKAKQAKEQQHHRKLPHVNEEAEAVEEEDEAGYARRTAIARASSKQAEGAQKESKGPSETLAMEAKYGRLELSPLPLRRALLSSVAGRKCGPSTPVPTWKMYDNPFQAAIEPANSRSNTTSLLRGIPMTRSGGAQVSLSARKLAATLWELQGAPNPLHIGAPDPDQCFTTASPTRQATTTALRPNTSGSKEGVSQHVNGMPNHHHHQHNHHPHHEGKGESSKHSKLCKGERNNTHPRSPVSPAPNQVEAITGSTSFVKTSPSTDVNVVQSGGEEGSTLSCELVKVLNQIWSLEEQHNSSTSMVASLRGDLKKMKARVQELRTEQSSYQEDMEMLNKKLADEKVMLQERAQEAILAAIKPLKEELENERKLKLKLESKHKKLSKEMSDARKTLAKTMQEFEKEQKARELMEDVCDELAREIGEDKAQVEELKRQSAKYREEVEQERQMLQMAEVWREERVHMKLAEARLELEEKNDALDKLRGELEMFLRVKRSLDEGNNGCSGNTVPSYDQATPSALHIRDNQSLMKESSNKAVALDEKGGSYAVEELDDEVSLDDDLHSIELNRMSISGSYEVPLMAQGNGIHVKATTNGMPSRNETFQSQILSPLASGVSNGKQGDVSNLSLERISSISGNAIMAESKSGEIQEVESQPIGRGLENDVKDWDLGKIPVAWSREGLPSSWQNESAETKGSTMTREKERNVLGYMDSVSRRGFKDLSSGATVSSSDLHGNGEVSKLQVFEMPRDHNAESQNGDGMSSFSMQSSNFPASPTRQWAHSRSLPDPVSSRRASNVLEDMPEVIKDNSLKARLLEAKLEGQQAKLRNSKVH